MANNSETPTAEQEAPLTIAQGFKKYFNVRFANTQQLRHEAFKIRHEVYCVELGWEPSNDDSLETDDFDNYSYHVVLEHTASNDFAGSVRIVIPPPTNNTDVTPFESQCLPSINKELLSMDDYPKGSFGEISRIAVPTSFRRRPNEAKHPYIITETSDSHIFTEEERRHFPNIAIGLYLSAVAMAEIFQHKAMFVMVEPRLSRHLIRVGLPFEQVGEVIDYHGKRALFCLKSKNYSASLAPEVKDLYDIVIDDLRQQMTLLPYCDPTDK